ncbi:Gti1/Pac2 family-domain-containing protein [Auriculariales sp. MPI-PUGE-AT-0066]|nr:Gti1/Pac2 family-domain-containing protein [Auriculariales sp. MPI-PUGE-AT-0066]
MTTVTSPSRLLTTPHGDQIHPCWVKNEYDLAVLLNAVLKGYARPVESRFPEGTRKECVVSGLWCIVLPSAGKISRWTDGVIWSPSRIHGNFLIYRQVNFSQPRDPALRIQREHQTGPYSPALNLKKSKKALDHARSSVPVTHRDHDYLTTVYDRTIVASWNDNTEFTLDGMCKKTIQVFFHTDYRLISYYNPLDAHSGALPRASEVPAYRDLEMDEELLNNARWVHGSKVKSRQREGLLKDLFRESPPATTQPAEFSAVSEFSDDETAPELVPPPLSPPSRSVPSSVTYTEDSSLPLNIGSPTSSSSSSASSICPESHWNAGLQAPMLMALPAQLQAAVPVSTSTRTSYSTVQSDGEPPVMRISRSSRVHGMQQQQPSAGYSYEINRAFLKPVSNPVHPYAPSMLQDQQTQVYDYGYEYSYDYHQLPPAPKTTTFSPASEYTYPLTNPSAYSSYTPLTVATNCSFPVQSACSSTSTSPTSYYPVAHDSVVDSGSYKHLHLPTYSVYNTQPVAFDPRST